MVAVAAGAAEVAVEFLRPCRRRTVRTELDGFLLEEQSYRVRLTDWGAFRMCIETGWRHWDMMLRLYALLVVQAKVGCSLQVETQMLASPLAYQPMSISYSGCLLSSLLSAAQGHLSCCCDSEVSSLRDDGAILVCEKVAVTNSAGLQLASCKRYCCGSGFGCIGECLNQIFIASIPRDIIAL